MATFEEIAYCEHPASEVYGAMLWHLEELLPYMPNVSEIRTDEFDQTSEPGKIKSVRFWQGTSSNVPTLLRPFVSKNSLGWMDYATWTPDEYRIDWRTVTKHHKFTKCEGTNWFAPDPENPARTRCRFVGEFTVYGDKIPAMPAVIGRKIAPQLERIILGFMLPNFRTLAPGIGTYLDAKKAAAREARGA